MGIVLAIPAGMLLLFSLSILAFVSLESHAPSGELAPWIAAVDQHGTIFARSEGHNDWAFVYQCPAPPSISGHTAEETRGCRAPERAPSLAWLDGWLYLACWRGPLMRWHPEERVATVVRGHDSPAALQSIIALGGDEQLLVVDRDHGIWTYEPQDSRSVAPVRIAQAPEMPVDITTLQGDVHIAGAAAIWRHDKEQGGWEIAAAVHACALAVDPVTSIKMWSAGPDGLLEHVSGRVRPRLLIPLTGVAVWNDHLMAVDGQTVEAISPRLVASIRSASLPDDREESENHDAGAWPTRTSSDLHRAQAAYWLPTLSITLSARSMPWQERRGYEVELWLRASWRGPGEQAL